MGYGVLAHDGKQAAKIWNSVTHRYLTGVHSYREDLADYNTN
jgi:hypothetical protein